MKTASTKVDATFWKHSLPPFPYPHVLRETFSTGSKSCSSISTLLWTSEVFSPLANPAMCIYKNLFLQDHKQFSSPNCSQRYTPIGHISNAISSHWHEEKWGCHNKYQAWVIPPVTRTQTLLRQTAEKHSSTQGSSCLRVKFACKVYTALTHCS